jgi:hypothetical protein
MMRSKGTSLGKTIKPAAGFFLMASFIFSINVSVALSAYFKQVNTDGFGNPNNGGGAESNLMQVYLGKLYVGIENREDGCGVFSFDGERWEQVTEPGFGNPQNETVSSMAVLKDKLYAATSNKNGCEIYCYDGKGWSLLMQGGFGNYQNISASSMATYKDKLYVGTRDQTFSQGCEIWTWNGKEWHQEVSDGFGNKYNFAAQAMVVSSVSGKEKLYVGTFKTKRMKEGTPGCEVWSWDGMKWMQENKGKEGFKQRKGSSWNHNYIWSMIEYKNKLYVGTLNTAAGCEVWCYDGNEWVQANQNFNGFGDPYNGTAMSLTVFNNLLYVGTYNGKFKAELWSYDGLQWKPVIGRKAPTPIDLGDGANNFINSLGVFQGHLYLGVCNLKRGYGIWESDFVRIEPTQYTGTVEQDVLFTGLGGFLPYQWSLSDSSFGELDQSTGFFHAKATGTSEITLTDAKGSIATGVVTIEKGKIPEGQDEQIIIVGEAEPNVISNTVQETILFTVKPVFSNNRITIETITLDLSPLGMNEKLLLTDNGKDGDIKSNDGIYSASYPFPTFVPPGKYYLEIVMNAKSSQPYYGMIPLDVIQGYTTPVLSNIEIRGDSHFIPVTFDYLDQDGDLGGVKVFYRKQQEGDNWKTANVLQQRDIGLETNEVKFLSPSPKVQSFAFAWNSDRDEPGKKGSDYQLMLTPNDEKGDGESVLSTSFSIDNTQELTDEMAYIENGNYYIDKYPYPNYYGSYPTTGISWFTAKELCQERGKDLCSLGQWIKACRGPMKQEYPYGNKYGYRNREYCNNGGSADDVTVPSGLYRNCTNGYGVYDMCGNIFELIGKDEMTVYLGGGGDATNMEFLQNRCISVIPQPPNDAASNWGFRCCKEAD